MTIPVELMELWQQHSSASFPAGYGDKVINGVNLSLLDAEIAGCVRIFIHTDGKLDPQRIKNLRKQLIDLNAIILLMDQDELIYFDRLRKMANLLVQEVEKTIG